MPGKKSKSPAAKFEELATNLETLFSSNTPAGIDKTQLGTDIQNIRWNIYECARQPANAMYGFNYKPRVDLYNETYDKYKTHFAPASGPPSRKGTPSPAPSRTGSPGPEAGAGSKAGGGAATTANTKAGGDNAGVGTTRKLKKEG